MELRNVLLGGGGDGSCSSLSMWAQPHVARRPSNMSDTQIWTDTVVLVHHGSSPGRGMQVRAPLCPPCLGDDFGILEESLLVLSNVQRLRGCSLVPTLGAVVRAVVVLGPASKTSHGRK